MHRKRRAPKRLRSGRFNSSRGGNRRSNSRLTRARRRKEKHRLVEGDTAEAIIEGVSQWSPFFDFDVTPGVDIQAAVPVFQRAYEWRDSVS